VARRSRTPYRRVVLIREERAEDRTSVADVHRQAFVTHPDGVVELVNDLRLSLAEEPGLSLVATDDDMVIAHVMFTRNLLDAPRQLVEVQVLSPVGVLPGRQRQGVGSALIRHGLAELTNRGVPLVFLEGSPDYYSRLGFAAGRDHGFRRPSRRIPPEAFQVCVLPAYESWMTGTLVYRQEFWDNDAVGLRPSDPRYRE
jgi:putative acetyltransferase